MLVILTALTILVLPTTLQNVTAPTPLTLSFKFVPNLNDTQSGSIINGDIVTFTANATGGTGPYSFTWNFGDGSTPVTSLTNSTQHRFNLTNDTPEVFTVTCTVTDSTPQAISVNRAVTVQDWPVNRLGWRIFWNITNTDGINIWNVTYHNNIVIRDARLAAVQVLYSFGCSTTNAFYDEPGFLAMMGVKNAGNIVYQNSTASPNPYFEITSPYQVGGYDYDETFRFYQNGRWEIDMMIGRGGCAIDHIYEPHWRIDLALGEDSNNYMSQYTPQGKWQDQVWEGNYTDNGYRDQAHNASEWRWADNGRYYYITPTIIRADTDLPPLASDVILARNHPSEIELSHDFTHVESPAEFGNGELAFRRDIVLWFVPKILDHGPSAVNGVKDITLTFNPWGTWP